MKYIELLIGDRVPTITGDEAVKLEVPVKRKVTKRKHWWSMEIEVIETVVYIELNAVKVFYDQQNKTVVIRGERDKNVT
jgi:hypothetical protein